jgi:hypothetical protein
MKELLDELRAELEFHKAHPHMFLVWGTYLHAVFIIINEAIK